MSAPNTGLRFRVYIASALVDEAWVYDYEDSTVAAERQAMLCAQADQMGAMWRVETFDPDLPDEYATMVLSSTSQGMRNPVRVPIDADPLGDTIVADYRRRIDAARSER